MIVVLVAEEAAGLQTLRLVAERGCEIPGVLTSSGLEETGRGSTVGALARRLGIPTFDPALVRDPAFADWIVDHSADLLLNVHSLHIAHADVVAAPHIGSFNLHPGPLPRYAGLNAPSWAIYEGESRHAVTLHWMASHVDAGPIAYEAWFDITPADTGLRVATNCVRHGVPLVGHLLDAANRGASHVPANPQSPDGRRWFGRGAPHDGRLPWNLPARRIVDLVRAADYAPFPSPWGWPRTTLDGRELEVLRVAMTGETTASAGSLAASPGTIGTARSDAVAVAAADEWIVIERLRCDGKACQPAAILPAGHRFAPVPLVP
jgi:UDP-4-amino-4-deoxy-L-arabinose formyltransferase/UDP-glucuronic acid dehydrogenase (UDP-4-keto-hexauronic acid decarboxylating)